jgi:hypothetical protein
MNPTFDSKHVRDHVRDLNTRNHIVRSTRSAQTWHRVQKLGQWLNARHTICVWTQQRHCVLPCNDVRGGTQGRRQPPSQHTRSAVQTYACKPNVLTHPADVRVRLICANNVPRVSPIADASANKDKLRMAPASRRIAVDSLKSR